MGSMRGVRSPSANVMPLDLSTCPETHILYGGLYRRRVSMLHEAVMDVKGSFSGSSLICIVTPYCQFILEIVNFFVCFLTSEVPS